MTLIGGISIQLRKPPGVVPGTVANRCWTRFQVQDSAGPSSMFACAASDFGLWTWSSFCDRPRRPMGRDPDRQVGVAQVRMIQKRLGR